jgi:hypothetical protein
MENARFFASLRMTSWGFAIVFNVMRRKSLYIIPGLLTPPPLVGGGWGRGMKESKPQKFHPHPSPPPSRGRE